MSALLWWLIPLVATVIAVLWATMVARPGKPMDGHDGMARLRQFQHAMERPHPHIPHPHMPDLRHRHRPGRSGRG